MPEATRRCAGLDRRDLLAGLTSGAATALAAAGRPVPAAAPPAAGGAWSAEYRARKGAVSLALYRKRYTAPGSAALPVLFLVHGSSISALPSFDLTVPGAGNYSVLDAFAARGYDVWTMDFEGYGRSTVTAGNSDVKSGVADLAAAVDRAAISSANHRAHCVPGPSPWPIPGGSPGWCCRLSPGRAEARRLSPNEPPTPPISAATAGASAISR